MGLRCGNYSQQHVLDFARDTPTFPFKPPLVFPPILYGVDSDRRNKRKKITSRRVGKCSMLLNSLNQKTMLPERNLGYYMDEFFSVEVTCNIFHTTKRL